jgi:hypothetical protein
MHPSMEFLSNTAPVPADSTPWNPSSLRIYKHERRGRCPCTLAAKASTLVAVPYVVSGHGPAAGRRAGVRGLRPGRGVEAARGGPGRGGDLAAGVPQGPGEGAGGQPRRAPRHRGAAGEGWPVGAVQEGPPPPRQLRRRRRPRQVRGREAHHHAPHRRRGRKDAIP